MTNIQATWRYARIYGTRFYRVTATIGRTEYRHAAVIDDFGNLVLIAPI